MAGDTRTEAVDALKELQRQLDRPEPGWQRIVVLSQRLQQLADSQLAAEPDDAAARAMNQQILQDLGANDQPNEGDGR